MTLVYKLLADADWRRARAAGVYEGSAADIADGFIHLSARGQLAETAARHFRHAADLVVLEFESGDFGAALRWSPSRGGDLFPHLHGPLDPALVRRSWPAPLGDDGIPRVPAG